MRSRWPETRLTYLKVSIGQHATEELLHRTVSGTAWQTRSSAEDPFISATLGHLAAALAADPADRLASLTAETLATALHLHAVARFSDLNIVPDLSRAQEGLGRVLDLIHAALLMLDHQTGIMAGVADIDPNAFRSNVLALAKVGKTYGLPVILSASFADGPNGPLLSDLTGMFPNVTPILRPGEINAFDNPDVVRAVEATGRKQLVIAAVTTEVCLQFPPCRRWPPATTCGRSWTARALGTPWCSKRPCTA